MNPQIGIYTETMAKVYAAQGHWKNAAAIYRRLLAEQPTRKDWAAALADAEANLKTASQNNPEELLPLFREWIELLFRRERLQRLKKLKDKLQM